MTKARKATATTSRLARIARRAILAALAPRAFLPGAKGSGAPSLRLLAPFALTLAALLAPAAAQAAPPGLVPDGQFEVPQEAVGVAVDNSGGPNSGDVYLAGFLNRETFETGHLYKFDPTGNQLSPPFGEATAYSGTAVNPVNGNLYALGEVIFGPTSLETFNPNTGELDPAFPPLPVPPSANFEFFIPWTMVGIATDSAGNVYVPVVPQNEVLEYTFNSTSSEWELKETFTGGSGSGALNGPTAVAVDPSGNLWVADTGNGRIEHLSPADAPLSDIPVEGAVQSVAVDAHSHVFAVLHNNADFCGSLEPPCSHLVEYTSAGAPLVDLGAGEFSKSDVEQSNHPLPVMVAVNDSNGRVYVSDGINRRVYIYIPPTPPSIENELAVGVTTSEAKLGALVNPGGIGTSYRFEYGTTEAYGQSSPSPEGDVGTGFHARTVWASPSGLQPGTTYHYRVVVANELGEVQGQDRTFTTATAAQAACPNDALRTGFSATLPDCRAYEIVTPPNKFSAQPDKDTGGNGRGETKIEKVLAQNFAAPNGNRLAFNAEDVAPGSQSAGLAYLAIRGSAGWSFANEIPSQNYYFRGNGGTCPIQAGETRHSNDLSKMLFWATSGGNCGLEPELISGEPRGPQNIYLRDNTTGTYQLVNLTPPNATPADAQFVAASRDFSRIVFTERAQLTSEAPDGVDNLYEWTAGHVRLVTLLTNDSPVTGSFVAISSDGSHVFFESGGNLYARVDGAETLQLDASEASGPGGGGEFLKASSDGSRVVFTADASAALTADTQPGSGANLYLYDATAPAGHHLTDLTPAADAGAPALSGISSDASQLYFTADASAALTADTQPGSGANLYRYDSGQLTDLTPAAHAEVHNVIGVSEDGSSVYFVAEAVLPGSQPNEYDEPAESGHTNLYLSHAGAITFIAQVAGARMSANGAFLAFNSVKSFTGYDNTAANGVCSRGPSGASDGPLCPELFLYSSAANRLVCASCNPSGEAPSGVGPSPRTTGGASFESRPARNLTENGRLFFDTTEGLLPSDTNGIAECRASLTGLPSCMDVYEFEPAGVGTCADPAGCLFLISTGTGSRETYFIDASANGDDVFLREFQALVPSANQEDVTALYDARAGGGFPEPASPPPCTTAESCRPSPQPQPTIAGSPATATLSGPGNVHPRRRHHRKKHHRARRGYKRAANHNRRTAR